MADKTSPILSDEEIEKAQLLTLDEATKIEDKATQFATDTPAENLEESKVIFAEEHGRLIDLLVGQKVANAQLKSCEAQIPAIERAAMERVFEALEEKAEYLFTDTTEYGDEEMLAISKSNLTAIESELLGKGDKIKEGE